MLKSTVSAISISSLRQEFGKHYNSGIPRLGRYPLTFFYKMVDGKPNTCYIRLTTANVYHGTKEVPIRSISVGVRD
jgi:hypothetical protein